MKIDVLLPVASARLVLHQHDEKYRIGLDTIDNSSMSIGLGVAAASKSNTKVSAAPPATPHLKFQDAAVSAREYLDQHGLLRYVQALLHAVIQEKPMDPYAFMMQQLGASKGHPGQRDDVSTPPTPQVAEAIADALGPGPAAPRSEQQSPLVPDGTSTREAPLQQEASAKAGPALPDPRAPPLAPTAPSAEARPALPDSLAPPLAPAAPSAEAGPALPDSPAPPLAPDAPSAEAGPDLPDSPAPPLAPDAPSADAGPALPDPPAPPLAPAAPQPPSSEPPALPQVQAMNTVPRLGDDARTGDTTKTAASEASAADVTAAPAAIPASEPNMNQTPLVEQRSPVDQQARTACEVADASAVAPPKSDSVEVTAIPKSVDTGVAGRSLNEEAPPSTTSPTAAETAPPATDVPALKELALDTLVSICLDGRLESALDIVGKASENNDVTPVTPSLSQAGKARPDVVNEPNKDEFRSMAMRTLSDASRDGLLEDGIRKVTSQGPRAPQTGVDAPAGLAPTAAETTQNTVEVHPTVAAAPGGKLAAEAPVHVAAGLTASAPQPNSHGDLRQQLQGALETALNTGRLAEAIATAKIGQAPAAAGAATQTSAASEPLQGANTMASTSGTVDAADDAQSIKERVRQRLQEAESSGFLREVLARLAPPTAGDASAPTADTSSEAGLVPPPPEGRKDLKVERLRARTRDILLAARESGVLDKVLEDTTARPSGLPPATENDVSTAAEPVPTAHATPGVAHEAPADALTKANVTAGDLAPKPGAGDEEKGRLHLKGALERALESGQLDRTLEESIEAKSRPAEHPPTLKSEAPTSAESMPTAAAAAEVTETAPANDALIAESAPKSGVCDPEELRSHIRDVLEKAWETGQLESAIEWSFKAADAEVASDKTARTLEDAMPTAATTVAAATESAPLKDEDKKKADAIATDHAPKSGMTNLENAHESGKLEGTFEESSQVTATMPHRSAEPRIASHAPSASDAEAGPPNHVTLEKNATSQETVTATQATPLPTGEGARTLVEDAAACSHPSGIPPVAPNSPGLSTQELDSLKEHLCREFALRACTGELDALLQVATGAHAPAGSTQPVAPAPVPVAPDLDAPTPPAPTLSSCAAAATQLAASPEPDIIELTKQVSLVKKESQSVSKKVEDLAADMENLKKNQSVLVEKVRSRPSTATGSRPTSPP